MKKVNIALLIVVVGALAFVAGRIGKGKGTGDGSATDTASLTLPAGYTTDKELTMHSFAGMTEPQKHAALKALNETTCDCGCSFGTLAECRIKDPNCPKAPKAIEGAIALAKQGKNADEIAAALKSGNLPAAGAAPTRPAVAQPDPNTVYKVPVGDTTYAKGPANAKVTIIEFSEFQCPFCAKVVDTVKKIEETYGKDVRIVFKHHPLPFHADAELASIAALAAGEQGKFWQMHDKLFENQRALKRPELEKYAQELKLNLGKFKAALDSPDKYKAQIKADTALAEKFGATGTPAFFVNGKNVKGARPFESFKEVIDAEMKRADEALKQGVKPADLYAHLTKDGVESPPPRPAAAAAPAAGAKKIDLDPAAPTFGAKDAKVTIVEWSDFQCPFCSRVVPTLKQIKEKYPKDVRVQFRHQPLSFHADANLAAQASMAAHEQGKFWEMHDKLFENQKALKRPELEKYAQEIGLNVGKFKAALDSAKFKEQVDKDSKYGMQVGANGTPTFFVNGREISGAQPFDNFDRMIQEEIKKADALLGEGTKPAELYAKLLDKNIAEAPKAQAAAAPAAPTGPVKIDLGAAPVKGPATAPVTIVEFSDFQCPFCSRVGPTMKQIEDSYKGKVRIAFKHQPLPFHSDAHLAAQASMAAHEQGKFWEMHDKLFENQRALKRADLEKYAEQLGLNLGKFKAALDSGKFKAVVDSDQKQANSVGANGTPTFFVNGRQVVGAQPFESFKTIIDEELKKGNVARN